MATAAPPRAPPTSRRSISSTGSTSTSSSIVKGATARSAVNPRASPSLSSPARRTSVKAVAPSAPVNGTETRESLSASLKEETDKKEKLLVQIQDKEQTITELSTENSNLTSALNAAESRLQEFYADQSRMEEEMAARIEVIEKLRTQVRDLEKEKRDVQKRYNEQTTTFDAERQAFYDNEQHLKSRIQSLTQARKQLQPVLTSPSVISIAESEMDVEDTPTEEPEPMQDINDPEQEPAEMTALRLELSTLSTSHHSLQSTLVLLQTQLNDLKRVNNELQEENESYNILLRERTLNGQFDVLRMGGTSVTEASDSSEAGDDDDRDAESLLSRNTSKSVLDPVDERDERLEEQTAELDPEFQQDDAEAESKDPDSPARGPRRGGRRRTTSTTSLSSSAPRGESLANLPITGPGLDLAAELGRAENKDILEGRAPLENDRSVLNPKGKRGRKGTDRKASSMSEGAINPNAVPDDLETLKSEVKNLKDANKALSLYASKIIDRIISQEGFEHVLAVDYDKSASSPPPQSAKFTTFSNIPNSPALSQPPKRARPQSAFFSPASNASSSGTPPQERLTTFDDIRAAAAASKGPTTTESGPPAAAPYSRASRRSLSFDWSKFSMFGGAEKKPDPHLRPLTLKAGASSVVARKLDTQEDEEDRRERERLHATMKLMGIDKPLSHAVGTGKPSLPATPVTASTVTPSTAVPMSPATSSRFSFFRRANSDAGSIHSSPALGGGSGTSTPNLNLTQEALEQAEVQGAIAALDAHERQLSQDIAKGSPGGFTEIMPRRSGDRRSSRRSGSGSTVFSAGLKGEDDD
ncbi:uncharacterized protein BXZ73DRAFT_39721 [Epithele typhae]|uniref:uncharacterized protein n=1 Tax=Epithele typhae TaxID=378194 RepID=UPI002007241B|nr:uncharacterized protein BXZ73DRAFT_39721 [Epithele typhae]KAH9944102.1 hypothetical protein BXZ73DRAFT_39721 [Epithele typhae]